MRERMPAGPHLVAKALGDLFCDMNVVDVHRGTMQPE